MNRIKNVIVICDFAYTKGGSEKVAIESSIGLAKRGINVVYFCASGPIDERLNHRNIKVVNLNQVAIVENNSKIKGMIQGTWNFKAKKELEKILDNYKAEESIVHLHLWQKALSASVIKAIGNKKFKAVFTMHHYFMACPNGGFFNYKKNEICTCKCMSINCIFSNCDSRNYFYKIWRVIRLFIERNIAKSTRSIKNYFYISELGRNALLPYLDRNSKCFYVPNPININKKPLQDISKNDIYVYVGRLSKEKGVHLLAKVALELGLNILFVGDGECREEILSIYPQAKISGWVDKEQVDKYMLSARALIMPSLWYEGMPLSVMEAQSRGIPVIVTDTCAANEIIENGVNGYLFENNNSESLKYAINKITNDEELKALSNNSYVKFWRNDYSLDHHIELVINNYNRIIND